MLSITLNTIFINKYIIKYLYIFKYYLETENYLKTELSKYFYLTNMELSKLYDM